MAYPHLFGYDPFHRLNFSFHPPTYLPSFRDYIQPPIPSFMSYPPIWCHHYHNSSHVSEQCPSIGYSLELGPNQFHTFQGLMSEPYPSNFELGSCNGTNSSWNQ